MADMVQLSARAARAENEVTVDLLDGTFVTARKEDMTLLVFDGRVPMPLLAAVQRMIDMPGATDLERLEALGTEHGGNLVKLLREHACSVVMNPKVTMEDTGDPDTLPVTYFSTPKLMAIWTATAVVPRFTTAAAGRFRVGASADVAAPGHVGEEVPPAAEQLVAPAVELISG